MSFAMGHKKRALLTRDADSHFTTLFIRVIWVVERKCHRIKEDRSRFRKRDAVLV